MGNDSKFDGRDLLRHGEDGMAPRMDADTIATKYAHLEERATAWVEDDQGVRAAVVIGSRARTDHPADEWVDLDVVF